MSTLPAANAISNAATQGELKGYLEALPACAKETPGGAAISELTIASGSITPTGAAHTVDTESDAATDDLDNILTTNHPEGRVIKLRMADAARVVTVKHAAGGAGQIHLQDGADMVMSVTREIELRREGDDWHEVVHQHTHDDRYYTESEVDTALGAKLAKASNLSDLDDAATARSNLGLGSAAVESVASGGTGGLLRADGDGSGLTGISEANCLGISRNLVASAPGTSATVSLTCDEIVLEDSSNAYKTVRSLSLSGALTTSGANGLDKGSVAASTWYAMWIIAKSDGTTALLFSLSATSPTLPSGYTFAARVGWIRTDSTANMYPLSFKQIGRKTRYIVASGSNVTAYPIMISGAQGSYSAPTWVAFSTANFVPTTAKIISVLAANGSSSNVIAIAPNNTFGAFNTSATPGPLQAGGASGVQWIVGDIVLETTSLYTFSMATSLACCVGWEE